MYEEGKKNDLPLSLENNFLFLLVDNSLKLPIHVTVSVWKWNLLHCCKYNMLLVEKNIWDFITFLKMHDSGIVFYTTLWNRAKISVPNYCKVH